MVLYPARTNALWWAEYALRASEIKFVEGWLFKVFGRSGARIHPEAGSAPKNKFDSGENSDE